MKNKAWAFLSARHYYAKIRVFAKKFPHIAKKKQLCIEPDKDSKIRSMVCRIKSRRGAFAFVRLARTIKVGPEKGSYFFSPFFRRRK